MPHLSDVVTLLRLSLAGAALWVLPWWGLGAGGNRGGAASVCMAFLWAVAANVFTSYALILAGVYTPEWGLILHIGASCAAVLAARRRFAFVRLRLPWPLCAAVVAALFVRLPDAVTHLALGGNDPWGHLVLCSALAMGDPIAAFHDFSFYPRGFHALVLTLEAASGVPRYEVMRLFGPLLSLGGVVGAYALARRAAGVFGGYVAAFVYAVPAYRHLVLPSVQTALEPDRFAFVLLPGMLLLIMDLVERPSTGRAAILVVVGVAHMLVHPLSVQFALGWIACASLASALTGRRVQSLIIPAILIVVFAWSYFHVMRASYGIRVMSHLAPTAALSVGGFGVDLRRILLGTGWQVQTMDVVAVCITALLIWRASRRRDSCSLILALVLLHTTYSAVRDALYMGDFGHAPPYYAMAFAWAAGCLAGELAPSWRRGFPMACMALLLGRSLLSGISPAQGMVVGVAAMLAAGALALTRARDGLVAVFVGVALFSLRPQPVTYPRLGYPEAVRWAMELMNEPPGTVFSSGLVSRMPDGTPFPTQDPVRSIVWPHHRPGSLSSLLTLPPGQRWPANEPAYAMVETVPHGWGFPYFAFEERRVLMERTARWIDARVAQGAPVRTVHATERMVLLALHDGEGG